MAQKSAQPSQKPAPDSTRRSERSRRAIYDAALALVSEVGYPKTTIEGIAARAGVGKQTIYRWWSSKADVLLEAFIDLSAQAAEAAGRPEAIGEAAEYEIPDTGDLEADLKQVLRATVDELLDPKFEVPSRALAAEGVVNEELGSGVRRQAARTPAPAVREAPALRPGPGAVRADIDPRIALELFVSPLAQRWLQYTGPISYEYTDTLVDYALDGLAPR